MANIEKQRFEGYPKDMIKTREAGRQWMKGLGYVLMGVCGLEMGYGQIAGPMPAPGDPTQHPKPLSGPDYAPTASAEEIQARLAQLSATMPLKYNKHVQSFINYFTQLDRDYIRRVQERVHLYFPIFEEYLARYGLPDELKYLAIVESGLRPDAVSRAGAVGLWQFMPATGRLYGLSQSWYVDERRDPYEATEAACRYLKFLHGMFGDWELALAAFNSGPGRVSRAIRRSGGKRSFWKIYRYLSRETRSYVPQFVAITYTFNYAFYHHIFPEKEAFLPTLDSIYVRETLHLGELSRLLGICLSDLRLYNPQFMWDIVPPRKRGGYHVRIPAHKKADIHEGIIQKARQAGEARMVHLEKQAEKGLLGRKRIRYRVRRGDVLISIAKRHRVRVSDIKRWNRLRSSRIYAGQRLTLWVRAPRNSYTAAKKKPPKQQKPSNYYVVQRGDTLWTICERYNNLNVAQLKRLNNLKGNLIKPGQKLLTAP